jgi:hypothetical protein
VPTTPALGVEIDYERHDGITPAGTTAFMQEATNNIHGRGYLEKFYTNPLYGAMQPLNGIDASNTDKILKMVDTFGILVWPANPQGYTVAQDLDLQMSFFSAPDFSKFNLTADMAMTPAQATTLHAMLTSSYPFGGVELFLDGQSPGTATYNQVLSNLLGMGY